MLKEVPHGFTLKYQPALRYLNIVDLCYSECGGRSLCHSGIQKGKGHRGDIRGGGSRGNLGEISSAPTLLGLVQQEVDHGAFGAGGEFPDRLHPGDGPPSIH